MLSQHSQEPATEARGNAAVAYPVDRRGANLKFRNVAAAIITYAYNGALTRLPSHTVRRLYLLAWLGGLGRGTDVQMGCRFLNGRKVFLGDRNVINFGCLFDGRKYQISTGSNVSIGPEAAILTLGHQTQSPDFADCGGDVVIGDRVWIGYRAIVLAGVRLGEGAVVGAGAVVTRDVEPFTVVAGAPARKVADRNRDLRYELHYKPFLT
jgi:maltose O-acetyltransferase